MSRKKISMFVGLVIAIGCAIASALFIQRRATFPTAASQKNVALSRPEIGTELDRSAEKQPQVPLAAVENAPTQAVQPKPAIDSTATLARSLPQPDSKPHSKPAADANANPSEPIVPVPMARVALSLVGADPDAEAVWNEAINDPNVSAHDRQDLIEDLNEDGLADPKNVRADDLPLIENRLALIEELAPDAMDEVNAAAFAEAYKDLANMYERVVSR